MVPVKNYYLMLDLDFDPAENRINVITDKISAKKKEWSANMRHTPNDLYSKACLDECGTDNKTDKITPKMMDQNERSRIAKEAQEIVTDSINSVLNTTYKSIAKVTNNEVESIAKTASDELKYRYGIPYKVKKDYVVKILRKKKITIDQSSSPQQKTNTRNNNNDPIKEFLSEPKNPLYKEYDNLYDFLSREYYKKDRINTNLPCDDYKTAAKDGLTKLLRNRKNNAEETYKKKHYELCKTVFENENRKAEYDNYLIYEQRKRILDDAIRNREIASAENLETMHSNYIEQLCSCKLTAAQATILLDAYCLKHKGKTFLPSSTSVNTESLSTIKTCRYCGAITDTAKRVKKCSKCGKNLFVICPGCQKEISISVNQNFCECGYDIRNIDKARALYDSAEDYIKKLDYDSAEKCIKEAEKKWPKNNESNDVKKSLEESRKEFGKFGENIKRINKAISDKRFFAARDEYSKLKQSIPEYSDPILEASVNDAIDRSNECLDELKKLQTSGNNDDEILKLCSDAMAECTDNNDINKIASRYSPQPPTNLKVNFDNNGSIITLNWVPSSSGGTNYIIVRKKDTLPLNVNDGDSLEVGVGMRSHTDKDTKEPGVCYYYAVYAKRAGIISRNSITNANNPVYCLTEPKGFTGTPQSKAVSLKWNSPPPSVVSVKLFRRSSGTDKETELEGIRNNQYNDSGLTDGCVYTYRLTYEFNINGRIERTESIISVTPDSPPQPIDEFYVEHEKDDRFTASWENPQNSKVVFYKSSNYPPFVCGDTVTETDLKNKMQVLAVTQLPQNNGEYKGTFMLTGDGITYITPVVLKSGNATIGKIVTARKGVNIKIKDIRNENGKITIYLDPSEPPEGLIKYIILSRPDRYVKSMQENDVAVERKTVLLKEYKNDERNSIILGAPEERDYYFTVFAEFKSGSEEGKDYSTGAERHFINKKEKINYTIRVSRDKVFMTFSSDKRQFHLPAIDICTSINFMPMIPEIANLLDSIDEQDVDGRLTKEILLDKNTPRNTYLRAFLRDRSLSGSYELDTSSDMKIK